MVNFWKNKRVIVTGGSGFLGSHLADALREQGCEPIIPRSIDYDLRYTASDFFDQFNKVDIVFNLAANVGGIGYNQAHPYVMFYDNILMGTAIIDACIHSGVKKIVQVGTVCMYPKFAPIPFREESIWDGYPENTNAPYGLAKKMLLVQLQAARQEFGFNGIYVILTNLYGPRDEFSPARSHVIPAMIAKFTEAKEKNQDEVVIWGSGKASRDFLYVKDAANGLLLAAEIYDSPEPLNLGSGNEVNISALVYMLQNLIDYKGKISYDISKPDGQPRRKLSILAAKQALGWQPETKLQDGLRETIDWYMETR